MDVPKGCCADCLKDTPEDVLLKYHGYCQHCILTKHPDLMSKIFKALSGK